ncbi:hypothetical protein RJ55_04987 [Drechmeria coniospora]|nr:hypothetical protein RJ55_04987 [Drechmeria coniospora]
MEAPPSVPRSFYNRPGTRASPYCLQRARVPKLNFRIRPLRRPLPCCSFNIPADFVWSPCLTPGRFLQIKCAFEKAAVVTHGRRRRIRPSFGIRGTFSCDATLPTPFPAISLHLVRLSASFAVNQQRHETPLCSRTAGLQNDR